MKKQLILATLVLAVTAVSAIAQPPAGGPPGGGFGGFGGGRGGGFGGQRGGMFGGAPRELTLANAPLPALVIGFTLTAEQEAAIKVIQDKVVAQATEARQQMMQGFQGGNFDPSDRAAMQARMQEMQEKGQQMQQQQQQAEATASRDIQKLLTPEQANLVTPTIKKWRRYQDAGLDVGLAVSLKLTAEQEAALDAFIKNRPAPGQGRGGPGGANGRAGGGANGRAGRGGNGAPPPPPAH
jgi:Spy/CpxP family protein refolding chaperone